MALIDPSQLKLKLLTSGLRKTNTPLHEVINQLIDAVTGVSSTITIVTGSTSSTNTPTGLPQTFITRNLEQATLPNSKQLVAGSNIVLTDLPDKLEISSSGGGGGLVQENNTIFSPGWDGDDGDQGPPGLTGATGAQGIQGIQGPQGIPGTTGPSGLPAPLIIIPGWDGDDGDIGPPGLVGATGLTGAQGIPGTSTYFVTGTGIPQGVQALPIGTHYLDTNTGYRWYKVGGGSTAYGWYLDLPNGGAGQGGPIGFQFIFSSAGASNLTSISTNGYGPLQSGFASINDLGMTSPTSGAITDEGSGHLFKVLTSAASTGTNMYASPTGGGTRDWLNGNLDIWIEFITGSVITNTRIWFGISNSVITNSDTFGTGGQGSIMFRYSTSAPDGGWIGQTTKNGATNHTESATVNSIAASTQYKLRIRFIAATPIVYFSVNDGTEVSLNTNIPPTGQTYFPIFGLTCLANTANSFGFRSIGGWQG